MLCPLQGLAQEKEASKKETLKDNLVSHVKPYGFIRNYFAFDTRESVAGTADLFYYVPKDESLNAAGEDLNAQNQFRFVSLTSRLGFDVSGYQINGLSLGAKIEADFYNGLSKSTGTAVFRLRQAYLTMGWKELGANQKSSIALKMGQAWHPMAADMPDIISLNAGAPFGPFSRTPLVNADFNIDKNFALSLAAIWEMQYTSAGPSEASADYIKYGCTPEFYLGLSYKNDAFLARAGVDLHSIKPRTKDAITNLKVNDRITTMSSFLYLQYKKDLFAAKLKTTLAQAGEHMNLNGGYGVSELGVDGYKYTPSRNSSTWLSLSYGKKLQGILFAGYVKNFGTKDELVDPSTLYYFSKNSFSNMTQMYRVTPTIAYNIGKFTLALEYELTSIQYGSDLDNHGLATKNLHWITNNRVQMMTKFAF